MFIYLASLSSLLPSLSPTSPSLQFLSSFLSHLSLTVFLLGIVLEKGAFHQSYTLSPHVMAGTGKRK